MPKIPNLQINKKNSYLKQTITATTFTKCQP